VKKLNTSSTIHKVLYNVQVVLVYLHLGWVREQLAMKLSRQWIGITLLIAVGHGIWAYTVLPERVASHWDGAGNPNGYMSRDGFVSFYLWLMVGLSTLFGGIGALVRVTPDDAVNLPNKEYWLAPERREATITTITQQMNAFTIMLNAFMIGIHQLSIMANLTPDKHLSNGVWVLLLGFLGGTGFWVYKMITEFKVPQTPID
jgi:serine/threonine-protein kinase